MNRCTPMSRSPLSRGKPLRRQSRKAAAKARQWRQVSAEAIRAAGNRCVVGLPGICTGVPTPLGHHKQLRSQGGENVIGNCCASCAACHAYIHRNPAWSYANNWLIRRSA